MGPRLAGMVIAVLATTGSASADVLCKKKSGAVFERAAYKNHVEEP